MAFNLSPSVVIKEFDLTGFVPAVATTEAAIAGVFRWGPLNKRILIDFEPVLVERFGKPTNYNPETFFTAASFLAYSNKLYVSRVGNTAGLSPTLTVTTATGNATATVANTSSLAAGMIVITSANSQVRIGSVIASVVNSTAFTFTSASAITANGAASIQFISNNSLFSAIANTSAVANLAYSTVENEDVFNAREGNFDSGISFIARYPGEIGNSLRVSVCDSTVGFNSLINLQSFSNGATISMNVGSNTASIVIVNNHDGSSNTTAQTAVVSSATSLKGSIQLTDYIQFGNTTAGFQSLKVTEFGNTTSTVNGTVATSTFTLSFEDELKLIEDQVVDTTIQRFWEYYDFVDTPPGQSAFVRQFGNSAANDELHIIVVDEGGLFSGVPGTILETYRGVSRATDCKTVDGAANYYKTVINQSSKYVYSVRDRSTAVSNNALNVTSASNTQIQSLNFSYGADGSDENTVSLASLAAGYDLYASGEDVDVSLILQGKARGGLNGTQLANYIMDNITTKRLDCIAFISPDKFDVVNNFGNERAAITEFNSGLRRVSYGFFDSGYKYLYDRYNDVYRWVPLNGDTAGLCAQTDLTNDAWWSPAGFNRGKIKNCIKLAYNPRKADRDELYKIGANPVVNFPGNGFVLFGDKTLLDKPSAFDRINVRRLFIVLEKAIATASKFFLFEINDDFTRAQFRNLVVPYLREIQGRRGITDFRVICDKTNNTPERIDNNEMVGDIYIKPARSINTVTLNFIAVRTGVSFEEVIGNFGG